MSTNPLHSNEKLFARQLNASEYISINNLLTVESFKAGHLFASNDTRLYRLQRVGKVQQFFPKPENEKERAIKAIKPNEWFNYQAFFSNSVGRERFRCVEDCLCWALDRQKFIDLLKQDASLVTALPHNNDVVQILAACGGLRSDDNAMPDLRKAFFKDEMSDDNFLKVARIIRAGKANLGEVIVEQGGNHTRVYYLRNGRLRARQINAKGADVQRGDIWTGMRANATSFIIEAINKDTLKVIETTKFWYIERDDFQKLIKTEPNIGKLFRPTKEVEIFTSYKAKYPWIKNGEMVQKDVKRHQWFFWRRVIPSIPIFLFALLIIFVFFNEPLGWTIFGVVAGLSMLFWVWWNYADWQNDYIVITDQRVVQREKVIGFFDHFEEIPIDRVDNITVKMPDWIQKNITNTGYIKVEAQGISSLIEFNMINDPDGLKNIIFSTRDFVRARKMSFQLKHLREFLTKTIEGFSQSDPPAAETPETKKTPYQKWREALITKWKTDLKAWEAWKPKDKFVDGKNIVYRRSTLHLLAEIGAPLITILVYICVFLFFIYSEIRTGWQTPLLAYCLPFSFFGSVLVVWFLYKYEDWRNDTYVLKPGSLVDNYRTPFALRGTRTVETGYEKITNTEARTNGIWGWFDIGDVVLKTGADGEIVLKGINSPRRVIQEIAKRRDKLEEDKNAKQALDRQREIGEALRIYDEYVRTHDRGTLYAGQAGRVDE